MDKDRFYYNHKFLGGMSGRPLRILSEYLGPLSAFQKHNIKDTIDIMTTIYPEKNINGIG